MSEWRWRLTRWCERAVDLAADAPHLALAELQHQARRVLAVHDRSDPICARGHRRPRTRLLRNRTAGVGCRRCQDDRRWGPLEAQVADIMGGQQP